MKKKRILSKERDMKNYWAIVVWLNVELISDMIYQGQDRRGLAYTNIWKQLMFIASKKETKMQN